MEARLSLMSAATREAAPPGNGRAGDHGLGILGADRRGRSGGRTIEARLRQANESAQALRQSGKLREARAQLLVCVAASCPAPVRTDCAERVNEIERAMPTLVFDVKDKDGIAIDAVAVASDGAPLVTRLDGSAVPIDPGEHVFRFSAKGFRRSNEGSWFARERRNGTSRSPRRDG